jgi:hypothetical protein
MGTAPCGFCGLDTARQDGCKSLLTFTKSGNTSFKSTCPYFYSALSRNFDTRKIWSKKNKCTNHLMHCPFCKLGLKGAPFTVWSYNFILHLFEKHALDGKRPELPPECWLESQITKAEELALGIEPENTAAFRIAHDVLDSGPIEALGLDKAEAGGEAETPEEDVAAESSNPQKRARSATNTSVASRERRTKKR